jgi:hypothetical protein
MVLLRWHFPFQAPLARPYWPHCGFIRRMRGVTRIILSLTGLAKR